MALSSETLEFARRVKAKRKQLGLTQVDVAESMGIAQSNYWEIEHGKYEITLARACRVARALGVSIHELVPDAQEPVA